MLLQGQGTRRIRIRICHHCTLAVLHVHTRFCIRGERQLGLRRGGGSVAQAFKRLGGSLHDGLAMRRL